MKKQAWVLGAAMGSIFSPYSDNFKSSGRHFTPNKNPSKRQVIAKKHRDNAKAKTVAKQKAARKHKNRRR